MVPEIPLATSPLGACLVTWAHGTDLMHYVGDIVRLHDEVRELLEQLGVPQEHLERICGTAARGLSNGAVDGARDIDTKSDAVSSFQTKTASPANEDTLE